MNLPWISKTQLNSTTYLNPYLPHSTFNTLRTTLNFQIIYALHLRPPFGTRPPKNTHPKFTEKNVHNKIWAVLAAKKGGQSSYNSPRKSETYTSQNLIWTIFSMQYVEKTSFKFLHGMQITHPPHSTESENIYTVPTSTIMKQAK